MINKKALREDLIIGLITLGYAQHAEAEKYVEYRHAEKPNRHLYVGTNGGLRVGPKFSKSEAVNPGFVNYAIRRATTIRIQDIGRTL